MYCKRRKSSPRFPDRKARNRLYACHCIADNLCGFKSQRHSSVSPLLDQSKNLLLDDKEKANLLNDVFINQNTSLALEAFPFGPSPLQETFDIYRISPKEVAETLRSLPNKSSCGSDEISYRLMKEAGPALVGPLVTLFNRSLLLRQVPDEWKKAIVIPIFKGGRKDRQEPRSYWPISLTSCVARTMEKIVKAKILNFFETNTFLYPLQSGFLPTHSTVTQLAYLVHQWQIALDRGESIESVFLDLRKAYDRVSHQGLINKLSTCGFSYSSLERMTNFTYYRKQCVRLNGTESTWLAPRSGTPQGTAPGPMLPLTHINDLPTQLESSCAIFADDTTVHAASSDSKLSCARISADLDVAAEWADSWGMLFSAEKSEHLHIGKATGQRVTMRGVPIPQVKHHRHLGLAMNNKLSWTEHIKDVHGTCSRMIGILRRLLRRLQGTTVKAIFIGAIRPRMEYASQVWSGGPTQSLQRLSTRFILQETWDSPASATDSIRLSLSGSALQDEIKSCTAILMHTSSPASFSNCRIFISKVRVPSSSHKKIINIGELSPTVDRPLERTAEGNPRVQHVDQVQNQTKNPFTYLMSTVASFKTPDDLLYCFFFN